MEFDKRACRHQLERPPDSCIDVTGTQTESPTSAYLSAATVVSERSIPAYRQQKHRRWQGLAPKRWYRALPQDSLFPPLSNLPHEPLPDGKNCREQSPIL